MIKVPFLIQYLRSPRSIWKFLSHFETGLSPLGRLNTLDLYEIDVKSRTAGLARLQAIALCLK
jgi:hypothetical protein